MEPTEHKSGWAPGQVWKLWRTE